MKPGPSVIRLLNESEITMNKLLLVPLLAAALALPALAQQAKAEMTDGEIRKVDKDAKKLTIKHAEIKALEMPPMTMVFQVKDPALLDKLKSGDKVRFAVEKNAAGAFVVTDVQPAP